MKNRTIEVLVDAGSSAVRVAIVEINNQKEMTLLGVGCVEGTGIRRGVIIDMKQLDDALQRAIDAAERSSDLKINSAWFAVNGETRSFNSDTALTIRQRSIRAEHMAQLYAAATAAVQHPHYHILHALRQQYTVDEFDGIIQPQGMVADRLGIRVHVIQSPVMRVRNLEQCSKRIGVESDGFISAGLAAGQAVISEDERQLGCCVADIGAGTIDFIAWYQGKPIYTGSLPIGGEYASSDLAQLLKIPRAYAETLKCDRGSLNYEDDSGEVSVSSTGLRGHRQYNREDVNEILRQRYQEILTLLLNELRRDGCLQYLYAGLVLTGGAARMRGLEQFATKHCDMPVRIAKNPTISGLSGYDEEHCFSVICGMSNLLINPFADGVWVAPPKHGIINRLKSFFQR